MLKRRRVHLHGPFRAFHDGPIEIVAETVHQALEGVTRQVKGFLPNPKTGRKVIQVPGFDTLKSLYDPTDVEDIHVWPAMTFGKGGLFKTLVGLAEIAVAIITAPLTFGTSFSFLTPMLFMTGLGTLVGGLMQIVGLAPSLNGNDSSTVKSRYISAVQNTVSIGTPIGLLYGRYRIGGQLMSLNVEAKTVTS